MIKNIILLFILAYGSLLMFGVEAKETRGVIAVLDTGISKEQHAKSYMCEGIGIPLFGNNLIDRNGHGTNVVGLIAEQLDESKYCIFIVKTEGSEYYRGLDVISKLPNLVGLNLSWDANFISTENTRVEFNYLSAIAARGARIIIAAGNKGISLGNASCNEYPACHKRNLKSLIIVGNRTSQQSNYGILIDKWVDGSGVGTPIRTGTSQSAAIYTGIFFSK